MRKRKQNIAEARWGDICIAMALLGQMSPEFRNGECRKLHKLLDDRVAAGVIRHRKSGAQSWFEMDLPPRGRVALAEEGTEEGTGVHY